MLNLRIVFFLSCLLLLFSTTQLLAKENKQNDRLIAGWLEKVVLVTEDKSIIFRAKLDTGANTSSLHAFDIKKFKKNDQAWVSFKTQSLKEDDPIISLELPVKRIVRIKRHFRPAQERPVVEMPFCMDSRIYTAEFSLVDRKRFNYPVLLGRRLLQKGIIVDPSATFTQLASKKTCGRLMDEQPEAEEKQIGEPDEATNKGEKD